MLNRSVYILFFLTFLIGTSHSKMIMDKKDYRIKAFYSHTDIVGWSMVLKGKVISFSSKSHFDKNDLMGRAADKSKVTVRAYDTESINIGDTLFIINSSNLIVSRFKVANIFKSASFGPMLVGYGNFKLASLDDRVVQKVDDELSGYSHIHKARGDYYQEIDDSGKAISEYKKSLTLDNGNPSARLELGYIYLNKGLNQFAFKEFAIGYANINRLYDNEDKYRLLKGMALIRYDEIYHTQVPMKLKDKYRGEAILYCEEALKLYPDSTEINYLLGYFYYNNPEPLDKKARDYFLKVVELCPEHTEAYVRLSELYYKHKNTQKALKYAENALKHDPSNLRARGLIKYIKNYNK